MTVAARNGEADNELCENWYVACTTRELRRRRLLPARILDRGIVVFRRSDGSLAALLDQCLHRGTALSGGHISNDCVVCPYHGWRYDGQGRVVQIPSEDGASAVVTQRSLRLQSFPVREAFGLIWVYLGERESDGSQIFSMPFWKDPEWVTYYMVSRFDGTVSSLAQNFMDVPHTVHVHETIFRKSPSKTISSTVALKPASVEVEYHDTGDSIGMMPWLTNPNNEPLVHTDKFFAPNVTRCDYHWGKESGFVITSQITPVNEHECRVYTLISYRFPWPRWVARILRPIIHLYTRIVLEQDVRIMRVNRRGLDNAPDFRPRSVRADLVHVGIERVIDAVRTGQPIAEQHLGDRSVEFHL
jgi:phenylpropionate dioxygenase-like ring-hydroxylating dioxygenase large terminal subunit